MLKLNNISYIIDNKTILNNINLTLEDNKTYIITGPNGSGKSTLAKIIMGINKPTSGTILLNNEDVTNNSITIRAQKGISYGYQSPVKFKGLTIADIINISTNKINSNEELSTILASVGLNYDEYSNRELNDKLSGGEMKRIEIAGIINRPSKITILDEPEAGIDLWSFNDLVELFSNPKFKKNKTTIIISHQQKLFKIADEIILLKNGKIEKICNNGNYQDLLNCHNYCCQKRCKHE